MGKLFMTKSCQWIQGVPLKLSEELPHRVFVKFSVSTLSILCQFFSPDLIRSLSILLSQHYRFFIDSSVPALSILLSQPYRLFCPNIIDFFIDSSVPVLLALLSQHYRLFCLTIVDFFIDSSVPAVSIFYRLFCPSPIESSVPTCPQNECFCCFKWRSCKNRRSEWKLGR